MSDQKLACFSRTRLEKKMWAIKYYLTTNRINIKTRVDLKRESLGLLFKPKNIKIERYLSKAVFQLKNKLL